MMKNDRAKITVIACVVLLIAALAGIIWTLSQYVLVDWNFYPRNRYVLDLRDQELSQETYDKLQSKLPETWIVWNVPFQQGVRSSDTSEITVTHLTDEDVAQLSYLPMLKTVHGEQCTDYPQLCALARRMPDCSVIYSVPVGGEQISSDAQAVTVTELTAEDAQMLEYLPRLTAVDGSASLEYPRLMALAEAHPEWDVRYAIHIGNKSYSTEDTEIDVLGATGKELEMAMQVMPNVKKVFVSEPQATGLELRALREAYPNVKINWEVTIGEDRLSDDLDELNLEEIELKTLEEGVALADYFPQLEKLIFGEGVFPNEDLADLREEKRSEYKVVWTIRFTKKCKARTDDTMFMPIKQGEYFYQDKDTDGLEYCEDIIAMDIGHSRVRNIGFVSKMPHLTYFIVADTDVRDLTPLANHKELIWLELGWCAIESYEPLVSCTALEDLNMGRTNAFDPDPEPITRMKWLKNLWCMDIPASTQWLFRQNLPDTWIVGKGSDVIAYGWRKLPNYFKMRDALGMYYMD